MIRTKCIFIASMFLLVSCSENVERTLSKLSGYDNPGIHLLFDSNKITEEGYWILKANKHAARILLPNRRWAEDQLEYKWYPGDDNSLLNHGFGNASGTIRNGKDYIDGFYYGQPKPEFSAPIEIVQAWYDIEKPMREIRSSHKTNLKIEQSIREKFPELFK